MMKSPIFGPSFAPGRWCLAALLVLSLACADGSTPAASGPPDSADPPASVDPPASTDPLPPVTEASPLDAWWTHLSALCGQAFAGRLTSKDAADADMAEQSMTMHVRRCEERRLEIPFHVGENRSRTWVLTRTDQGLQLQHDHRHEDGSEDVVTLYGGMTKTPGTKVKQDFPADDYSKQLFEANGLDVSVANTWSMEIISGQRFSYILRRPERHFQVDFDLSQAVEAPPAPWGHE